MLFAKVHLSKIDKQQATSDIMAVDPSLWVWDDYRATSMLPLSTKGGLGGKVGLSNGRANEFRWLPYTPPVISKWFDEIVFPWMGMSTRVTALKTRSLFANKEHIDCDRHKMGTKQHKFRIVLHGSVATLYFKTSKGDVYVPAIEEPFIMDGSWPHGMNNSTDDFKLTLAAGAPWNGNDTYDNVDILMNRDEHLMPKYIDQYFNKPR